MQNFGVRKANGKEWQKWQFFSNVIISYKYLNYIDINYILIYLWQFVYFLFAINGSFINKSGNFGNFGNLCKFGELLWGTSIDINLYNKTKSRYQTIKIY